MNVSCGFFSAAADKDCVLIINFSFLLFFKNKYKKKTSLDQALR